jgi:hypothetical protein
MALTLMMIWFNSVSISFELLSLVFFVATDAKYYSGDHFSLYITSMPSHMYTNYNQKRSQTNIEVAERAKLLKKTIQFDTVF